MTTPREPFTVTSEHDPDQTRHFISLGAGVGGAGAALQRERAQFSQYIHDTTAQAAYMIGLGIDTAKALAGDCSEELTARLEATSLLSKTVIWELRHPIDLGRIFDGRELGQTLESHVATFPAITSVPAELVQNGAEPLLSVVAKSALFSISHNALTNAFRHAEATQVLVELDFEGGHLTMSVSDDGTGLPDDYAQRGHGFANMRASACSWDRRGPPAEPALPA